MNKNYLFFLGSKRSGTSILLNLLNHHREIFISPESDIVWILYQLSKKARLKKYNKDGPIGMNITLNNSPWLRDISGPLSDSELKDYFHKAQSEYLTSLKSQVGSMEHKKFSDLKILGDKKPMQHSDPAIFNFTEKLFPKAKYIHLVRHPIEVIQSMRKASAEWNEGVPDYWNKSYDIIARRWLLTEMNVEKIKKKIPDRVYTLSFRSLCQNPKEQILKLYLFLDMKISFERIDKMAKIPDLHKPLKYNRKLLLDIPELHGYIEKYQL